MKDYKEFMKGCLAEKEENLNDVMVSIFEEEIPPEIDLVKLRKEGDKEKLLAAKTMACHWIYQFLKAAKAQALPARVMRTIMEGK